MEQRYKYNNNLIVYFYGGNEITNDQRIYIEQCLRLLMRMINFLKHDVVFKWENALFTKIKMGLFGVHKEYM